MNDKLDRVSDVLPMRTSSSTDILGQDPNPRAKATTGQVRTLNTNITSTHTPPTNFHKMGDNSGLVTVSCPNHHETLVGGLWNSLTNQLGVDFDFELDGRSIRVHRFVVDAFLSSGRLTGSADDVASQPPVVIIDGQACQVVDYGHHLAAIPCDDHQQAQDERFHHFERHSTSDSLEHRSTNPVPENVGVQQSGNLETGQLKEIEIRVHQSGSIEIQEAENLEIQVTDEGHIQQPVTFHIQQTAGNFQIIQQSCPLDGNDQEQDRNTDQQNIAIEIQQAQCVEIQQSDNNYGNRQAVNLAIQHAVDFETHQQQQVTTDHHHDSSQQHDCSLDAILEFLYTGKTTVRSDRLDKLLDAARRLNFAILIDAIESSCQTGAPGNEPTTTNQPEEIVTSSVSTTARQHRSKIKRGQKRRVIAAAESVAATLDQQKAPSETIIVDLCQHSVTSLAQGPPASSVAAGTRGRKSKNSAPTVSVGVSCGKIGGAASGSTTTVSAKRGRPKKVLQSVSHVLFCCEQCDYSTHYKTLFQHHRAKHDDSIAVFRCTTCSRPFMNDSALQRHLLAKTCQTGMFECPHCDYKNVNKHSFRLHVTRHDPSLPFFRCDQCGVPFLDETALDRHKLKHVGSPSAYQCAHCAFVTPKFRSFRHHLINLHGVDENGAAVDKKFKCTECANSYVYESELRYHVTTRHCSARPFKCDLCSFCSSRKADVSKHVKIAHLGIKKYMCETCGFRAVTPYNLERHKVSHTGMKPFTCSLCGQAYGDRGSLKRHVDRHISDEKKFVCHLCAHSTRRGDHLKKHLKNVHKIT